MRPCLSGPQAARLGYSSLATQYRHQRPASANTQSFPRLPIPKRQISSQPPQQNHEPPLQPSDAEPQPQDQPPRKQGTLKSWILFNIAGLSAVLITAVVLKSAGFSGGEDKKVINKTSFSPFTIVSKEQVSPTAFILSVRAAKGDGKGDGDSAQAFREAWEHGLWSVEAKQPQLQIARHYTPLPPPPSPLSSPSSSSSQLSNENIESPLPLLRFLIRRVDGGEMSTYLGKLRAGDAVWLRGPHLGFDVDKRLGDIGRRVVFVAGGTGIAPALQVARRLLDGGGGGGGEGDGAEEQQQPTVSILWANRRAADALGRERERRAVSTGGGGTGRWFSSWWRRGDEAPSPSHHVGEQQQGRKQAEVEEEEESSFAQQQIRDLQRRHPDRFRVSYYVDEEGSFIGARDLRAALTDGGGTHSSSSSSSSSSALLPLSKTCPWHSPAALAKLPDDDDFARRGVECRCGGGGGGASSSTTTTAGAGAGANLICVSGPDGFIEAYAGPKRWYAGTEMQGPVRGVLGRMLADGGNGAEVEENWLVLKI